MREPRPRAELVVRWKDVKAAMDYARASERRFREWSKRGRRTKRKAMEVANQHRADGVFLAFGEVRRLGAFKVKAYVVGSAKR